MDDINYACIYGFGKTKKEALENVYTFKRACWAGFYHTFTNDYPDAEWVAIYLHVGVPLYRKPYLEELCDLFDFLEVEYISGRYAKVLLKIDREDTTWTHLFLGLLRLSWECITLWPKEYNSVSDVITHILIEKGWESHKTAMLGHTPFYNDMYGTLQGRIKAERYTEMILKIITEKIPFTTTKQPPPNIPTMKNLLYNRCLSLDKKEIIVHNPFE